MPDILSGRGLPPDAQNDPPKIDLNLLERQPL